MELDYRSMMPITFWRGTLGRCCCDMYGFINADMYPPET